MKKLVSFIFILLLATTLYAENSYKTKPNPWSGKPDFILGTDNLEVVNLNSSGTVTGLIVDAQRVENSSGTLTFNDPTTGVKTLAQLAAGGSGESTSVADTATINLTMVGTEITADGLYTGGNFLTLAGADFSVDTAAVGNGDTTHVPTCDGVYDFCETTQAYYNATADLDADLQDLADGSLTASKVAGVADADYGDVGVSSGAWSVENDSHDHSAAGSTVTINAADITDKNAGTDITADLEEEAHASEHQDGGADEIAVTSGMMNTGTNASASTFWRGDNTWSSPTVSEADTLDTVCDRSPVTDASVSVGNVYSDNTVIGVTVVATDTVTGIVVDTQYLDNASGSTITMLDSVNIAGTLTTPTITNNTNIKGQRFHIYKTIFDPLSVQTEDNEVCLVPSLDAAVTISRIVVTLNSTSNEILGDLKYADTFIGLANPTVVETFDTTSGVRDDSSMSGDATIPAGKCLYLSFDSAPNTAITQACFDITYSYD